jgi:hypothetical protein
MDADEFRAGLHVLAVDGDNISLILLAKQLRCCQYNGEHSSYFIHPFSSIFIYVGNS